MSCLLGLAPAALRAGLRGSRCCAAAACVVVVLLGGCSGRSAPHTAEAGNALDAIVARCASDMVSQTCRVMGNAPAGATSVPEGTVVFVAGVGAIDAQVYNRLLADGQAMCETVRNSCMQAWDGPACKTARALYAAAP